MGRTETIAEGITLHLGDCRDVLPLLAAVDAVVTDPVWPNVPAGSVAGSDDPWGLWDQALARMPAHARIIVCMRCDSDPRFLSAIPAKKPFLRSIQLPYVMPGYLGRILGGDETAYWFGDPQRDDPYYARVVKCTECNGSGYVWDDPDAAKNDPMRHVEFPFAENH